MHFFSRYALVVHALHDWRDPLPNSSLHDRADTLTFLLRNCSRPEDIGLGGSLWQCAVVMGEELLKKNKPVELAELLRIFLITAKSPRSLMTKRFSNSEVKDPLSLLQQLKGYSGSQSTGHSCNASVSASEVRGLGEELEQLTFSNFQSFDVSQRFHDIVSKESSTHHPPQQGRLAEPRRPDRLESRASPAVLLSNKPDH